MTVGRSLHRHSSTIEFCPVQRVAVHTCAYRLPKLTGGTHRDQLRQQDDPDTGAAVIAVVDS